MSYSLLRSIFPMCQCHWFCRVLVSAHEATNVRLVKDLGFSLHMTNMSQCVDALIGGNGVAMMLDSIKGHLKSLSIKERAYLSIYLFNYLCLSACLSIYLCPSVCLSFHLSFCRKTMPLILCINSMYLYLHDSMGEGQVHCHSSPNSLPITHPLCIWWRAIMLNHFWSTQEKKQKTIYALSGRSEVVAECKW